MFQSTLLFNELRQENYINAQPRLLYRVSFAALSDALVTHYQRNSGVANSPIIGLLIFTGKRHKATSITTNKIAIPQKTTSPSHPSLSELAQRSFIDVPELQSPQARHQHTVMLVSNLHDERGMGASSTARLPKHTHSTPNDTASRTHDDVENTVHESHDHELSLAVPLNLREELTLCYTPAFSYGLLGLEADPESNDPALQRMITVQLENTLDVIRALVKVVELLSSETALANDLRYFLLETLLLAPPVLAHDAEQTSYVRLINKLGCFHSDAERLESLALAVAHRLQAAKTSLTTLRTSLRTLADKSKRTQPEPNQPSLAGLAIPLAGAAIKTEGTHEHVMLAAVVATINDYLQHPKTGSEALFAMRPHVPERYPLQVFQSLSQHERDALTNATSATLSGIVEGEDLFSVLQMAQRLSRDGTLLLEGLGISSQRRGWVAFQTGQAVGIETQRETGLEALLEIILWGASQFSFYDVTSVTAQPLNKTSSELLMSIATYLDILERLSTLGFSPKAQWLRVRKGLADKYEDILAAAITTPSFNALLAIGYPRSTLLQALDYLTQAGWLEFGSMLEASTPPQRPRE